MVLDPTLQSDIGKFISRIRTEVHKNAQMAHIGKKFGISSYRHVRE